MTTAKDKCPFEIQVADNGQVESTNQHWVRQTPDGCGIDVLKCPELELGVVITAQCLEQGEHWAGYCLSWPHPGDPHPISGSLDQLDDENATWLYVGLKDQVDAWLDTIEMNEM